MLSTTDIREVSSSVRTPVLVLLILSSTVSGNPISHLKARKEGSEDTLNDASTPVQPRILAALRPPSTGFGPDPLTTLAISLAALVAFCIAVFIVVRIQICLQRRKTAAANTEAANPDTASPDNPAPPTATHGPLMLTAGETQARGLELQQPYNHISQTNYAQHQFSEAQRQQMSQPTMMAHPCTSAQGPYAQCYCTGTGNFAPLQQPVFHRPDQHHRQTPLPYANIQQDQPSGGCQCCTLAQHTHTQRQTVVQFPQASTGCQSASCQAQQQQPFDQPPKIVIDGCQDAHDQHDTNKEVVN